MPGCACCCTPVCRVRWHRVPSLCLQAGHALRARGAGMLHTRQAAACSYGTDLRCHVAFASTCQCSSDRSAAKLKPRHSVQSSHYLHVLSCCILAAVKFKVCCTLKRLTAQSQICFCWQQRYAGNLQSYIELRHLSPAEGPGHG